MPETESLTSEITEEADLSRGEESPAGTGWSNMGGGGDEHIGRADLGGAAWDEDWEDTEEYSGEEADVYGERSDKSEE